MAEAITSCTEALDGVHIGQAAGKKDQEKAIF
jgi:hypothetical protein